MPLDELGFQASAAGRLQRSHEALEARAAELRAAPREVAARGGFACTSSTRAQVWRKVADDAAERAGVGRRYDGKESGQINDHLRKSARAEEAYVLARSAVKRVVRGLKN